MVFCAALSEPLKHHIAEAWIQQNDCASVNWHLLFSQHNICQYSIVKPKVAWQLSRQKFSGSERQNTGKFPPYASREY